MEHGVDVYVGPRREGQKRQLLRLLADRRRRSSWSSWAGTYTVFEICKQTDKQTDTLNTVPRCPTRYGTGLLVLVNVHTWQMNSCHTVNYNLMHISNAHANIQKTVSHDIL